MKKKPVIHSLLAARPGALRRPPRSAAPVGDAPVNQGQLRLVRDDSRRADSADPRSPHADPATRKPALPSQNPVSPVDGVSAIHTASAALAGMHALLMDILDRMNCGGRPRRRSPREISEIQALIDRAIRDIERIVDVTMISGRRLLDGYFKFELPTEAGRPVRRAAIRSMQPAHLGPDATRSLGSLTSGGRNSLLVTSFEDAVIILRHAAGQVGMERHQLSGADVQSKLDTASIGDIARENAAAAMNANLDLDFAALTSDLTPGVALAASLSSQMGPSTPSSPPNLTLHRP